MDKQQLADYALAKEGAYLDFPFAGEEYAVVKVKKQDGGKSRIFAELFTLNGADMLTFSTDEETALFLRDNFMGIVVRGWHCPPAQAKYKSSVAIDAVDDEVLIQFIDTSYNRALSKL